MRAKADYFALANAAERCARDLADGGPVIAVGFGYDNDNLRTLRTATGESDLGFGYNARSEPTSITYSSQSFGYDYDLAGARKTRNSPDGIRSSYGYDGAGRLNLINTFVISSSANRLRQDFGRDLRDRRTWTLRDTNLGDAYVYQDDNQLTGFRFNLSRPDLNVNNAAASVDTYVYDQNGNRTERNENGSVTTYTPNALNEYSAVSGATIAHSDGRGNVTTWNGWTYTYDAENRLTSATATGQNFGFAYDAQGRLAKLTKNGSAEYRYFDGAQLFLRTDGSGTTLERVLWGVSPDEVLARWTSASGWHYFHQDPLNSPMLITNGSGAVQEKYLYDAYGLDLIYDGLGNARSTSALGNPWRFTGQEWIEGLNLHNYKNRFYSDDLGRFLQQDPLRFDAGDMNLYRYCGNNSINNVDPDGQIVDTIADVGFILYDAYRIVADNVVGNEDNLKENLSALGADALGAAVPFVSGGGMAVRAGAKAAEVARAADHVSDATKVTKRLEEAGDAAKALKKSPPPNGGIAKPHGGEAHNAAIDAKTVELQAEGATNIRKNQVQTDINGNQAGNNRPDLQADVNGEHRNYEWDTKESTSLKHQETLPANDPKSVNEFKVLPKK